MPIPTFSYNHRLSVWRGYRLHMHCCHCAQRCTNIEIAGLLRWHGDKTFAEILRRLRCMFCRHRPTFVSLVSMSAENLGTKHGARWGIILSTEDATG